MRNFAAKETGSKGARRQRHMNLQPFVYHLVEAENWPSIQQHGLLSTRALLDRIGIHGCNRAAVEREHRPNRTILPTGVVIRDQKPIPPAALERCLIGLTASQWYELLNSKVFFWFDPERLNRQRRACSRFPQVVLRIASDRLLRRYAAQTSLTPINTGNARRKAALRGAATFVPYSVWEDLAWLSEAQALGTRPRPQRHPPVELTVTDSVPDVMDFVLSVQYLAPNEYLPPHSSAGSSTDHTISREVMR
jgi:hypothetical protein